MFHSLQEMLENSTVIRFALSSSLAFLITFLYGTVQQDLSNIPNIQNRSLSARYAKEHQYYETLISGFANVYESPENCSMGLMLAAWRAYSML